MNKQVSFPINNLCKPGVTDPYRVFSLVPGRVTLSVRGAPVLGKVHVPSLTKLGDFLRN